jgi:hypothetical protein
VTAISGRMGYLFVEWGYCFHGFYLEASRRD